MPGGNTYAACASYLQDLDWYCIAAAGNQTLWQHDDEPSTWVKLHTSGHWDIQDDNEPPADRPGWTAYECGEGVDDLRQRLANHMVSHAPA